MIFLYLQEQNQSDAILLHFVLLPNRHHTLSSQDYYSLMSDLHAIICCHTCAYTYCNNIQCPHFFVPRCTYNILYIHHYNELACKSYHNRR